MDLNKKLYTFENLTTKFTPTQCLSITNNMRYIAAQSCVRTHVCHLHYNYNLS